MALDMPAWSPDEARAMAVRGNLAKAARRQKARDEAANLPALASSLTFSQECLALTRARIKETFTRLGEESGSPKCDGQRLNWLASALERLAELERILDGRPLPGSRRPAPEPSPSARPAPRPPAAPITRPDPSPAKQGEVPRASQLNASGAPADGNSSARSTFGRDEPGITTPLPKVDQPSTTPSVAPARLDPDEPDGIEYGPID